MSGWGNFWNRMNVLISVWSLNLLSAIKCHQITKPPKIKWWCYLEIQKCRVSHFAYLHHLKKIISLKMSFVRYGCLKDVFCTLWMSIVCPKDDVFRRHKKFVKITSFMNVLKTFFIRHGWMSKRRFFYVINFLKMSFVRYGCLEKRLKNMEMSCEDYCYWNIMEKKNHWYTVFWKYWRSIQQFPDQISIYCGDNLKTTINETSNNKNMK